MKVLFLGYGKMGSALGEAWLSNGLVDNLVALDPGLPRDVKAKVVASSEDLGELSFDLVVAAVKPAYASAAIKSLPRSATASATLLSIMAGVTCRDLSESVGSGVPVVRAMPNTPVLVNKGCTGLYSDDLTGSDMRKQLKSLFEAVGVAEWLDHEDQLHAVTAISGSGPAYYHLFSEALFNAAVKQGLPEKLARTLTSNTALGAAALQCQEDADFTALRHAVTSPNGTTAAAIEVFESHTQLRQIVQAAVDAASERSKKLAVGK